MPQAPQEEEESPKEEAVDLMKDILERAGLDDINEVPLGAFYSHSKTMWAAEQQVPVAGFEFLRIFALFQAQGQEVRVYAVPVAEPQKDKEGRYVHEPVAHRFTLVKTGPPYFVEIIRDTDVFKDEIAAELSRLANETMKTLYGDVSAVGKLERMRALVSAGRTKDAIDLLMADDEEEEDDEEEDEDEEDEKPVGRPV